MKFLKNLSLVAMAGLVLFIASCDKTKPYEIVVSPSQAHFLGEEIQEYFIESSPQDYNIVIGTTDVSDKDRVVKFQITSPTGAVAGSQYTINGIGADGAGSVIIKAGEVLANLSIKADSITYATGRKDTLIFNIIESDLKPGDFLGKLTLLMRGPCYEGAVDLNELLGEYNNCTQDGSPVPFSTTISAFSSTNSTSGTITVDDLSNSGWAPITFKLNWADPLNRIATLDLQENIAPGNLIDPSFDNYQIMVRAFAGQDGTFSICDQTLLLKLQIGLKSNTDPTDTLWNPSPDPTTFSIMR